MINTLPEFESRQVLTDDELNWVACYLDGQNRQTRQMLIGSGLLAGLQVRMLNDGIQLSNGIGLSSAGHVLAMAGIDADTLSFKRQLKYGPKEKEKLAFHYLIDTQAAAQNYAASVDNPSMYFTGFSGEVLELFEEVVNNTEPINTAALKGRVLMLFQEIIQKELKDCEDDNCQERGKKYLFNTKALVITKEDALRLLSIEYGLPNATEAGISKLMYPQLHLPNINILKPVFSNFSVNNGINETLLCNEYQRCIKDFADFITAQKQSIDTALSTLKNQASGSKGSYAVVDKLLELIAKTKVLSNAEKKPRIYQLSYDLLYTWVQAYQELQQEAQQLKARVLGQSGAHPQHIFCGLLDNTNTEMDYPVSAQYSIYRHGFRPRFAQAEQAQLQAKISLFLSRLQSIINHFDEPVLSSQKDLRLVAGPASHAPLSQKTIPYYLKAEVANTWSPWANHSQLNKYITRYSTHNESQIATAAQPYQLQSSSMQAAHGFYRIEGVYGQPAVTALNTVFQLRKKHGLAFEVLMLRLNEKAPFSHSFNFTINEDIESLYRVVRSELNKQIALNTSYLGSLQIRSNRFEAVKSTLIANLEASYFSFLGNLNGLLNIPLQVELSEAIFASNISTSPKTTSFAKAEPKYTELEAKANTEKLSTSTVQKVEAVQMQQSFFNIPVTMFEPIFNFELVGVFFFNTLGAMVGSIKSNNKFKNTSDISFYTHLHDVAKKLQSSEKGQLLFLQSLQLYCALKLQELYLPENFLDMDAALYKSNLEGKLLPACSTVTAQLKKLNADFVRSDETLQEVIKGEMLDYADRIKFDDDWVKIIQIDAENKKRNGGLGVENLLERFVKQHPGLSHGGGVPQGGTYILVYDESNAVTADFHLPYLIASHLRPITFTLLEQKTLTLSGKVSDDSGAAVLTTVLVGASSVLTDAQGFYNVMVAENSTVKVLVKQPGFENFEQELKITNSSAMLDIKLKKSVQNVAATMLFKNQLGAAITFDFNLKDSQGNTLTVKSGKHTITAAPGTNTAFKIADARFADMEFNIITASQPKEETITLTQQTKAEIQLMQADGTYDVGLFKSLKITNPSAEVEDVDRLKGLFASKTPMGIHLKPTAVAIYNGISKQQVLNPAAKNTITFDVGTGPGLVEMNTFVALRYPATTGPAIPLIPSINLNDKTIMMSAGNLGQITLSTNGTIKVDERFKNTPPIQLLNLPNIKAAVFLMDADVAALGLNVQQNSALFSFVKTLTAVDIRKLMQLAPSYNDLSGKIDLRQEIHYTLIMQKEKIAAMRSLLAV